MNVTYNNKPAIMSRNGQVVLGDTGGPMFQFIALDIDDNELGATEQIKVETVSTETTTEVQATFAKQYDYKFENGILQIYKAPYTFTDGTVWIKSEPSLQLMDYLIVEGNFSPNDEIKLTNDRQFVKDIKNGDVKTFFDNQPYADSVEAFMTLQLDNTEPSVYGNYLYTYEIITPFEFFVLKRDGTYTFELEGGFTLTGTLKSPAFIGGKLDDFDEFGEPLNYLIMVIDLNSGQCYFQKTKEINGELGTLKFDDTFAIFGLLGVLKRSTNVLDNNTYEFVATPNFEGLSSEAIIECSGMFPTAAMDFYGIIINPIEESIIFPTVSGGEGDETDWGYKNGVWGYDKNGTRVADDRIRTLADILTMVALSDEVYAFWQKNTTIIPVE